MPATRPQMGPGGGGAHPPPPQAEHLPCPRCDSTNTKFCYYNNYNLSQPRHFCKACRRYWTHGGTLRNIPVGGGTRKSSKRSRPSTSAASSASSSAAAMSTNTAPPAVLSSGGDGAKSEMIIPDSVSGPGSFTSLLGSQQGPGGFLALGGYGGFDEMGQYGFGGRGVWTFPEVSNVPEGGGGTGPPAAAWQLNGVENGLVDGDCFAWPELAISMPGQGLK